MNWLEQIGIGAILMSVIIGLISWWIRSIPLSILRFFRKHKGEYKYSSFGQKTILFDSKGKTRITIGVLASISDEDGNPLLIKSGNKVKRDTLWKPIGGAIKIDSEIEALLSKYSYQPDESTKYNAKLNDFRIFIEDLSNNKIIQKIIHNKSYSFYKEELIREMKEELNVNVEEIKNIFNFKQIRSCHFLYKDWMDSPMQVRDYSQQVIIKVTIKNKKEFDSILKQNSNIEFVDMSDGEYNISLPSRWLSLQEKVKIKEQ